MNQYDALKILGLSGQISQEEIKKAYKKSCAKYHPDRNPAGLEIMKLVNVAYDVLKSYDGEAVVSVEAAQYGHEVAQALNNIANLGLNIEICGSWVWVSGDTRLHKDTLKGSGYKWSPKKQCWYFRPADAKSRRFYGKSSMDSIRDKYGSVIFKNKEQQRLQA